MTSKDIKPGDWVRFPFGGRLVLGVVEYIVPINYSTVVSAEVYTDVGVTSPEAVLEVRRPR